MAGNNAVRRGADGAGRPALQATGLRDGRAFGNSARWSPGVGQDWPRVVTSITPPTCPVP